MCQGMLVNRNPLEHTLIFKWHEATRMRVNCIAAYS